MAPSTIGPALGGRMRSTSAFTWSAVMPPASMRAHSARAASAEARPQLPVIVIAAFDELQNVPQRRPDDRFRRRRPGAARHGSTSGRDAAGIRPRQVARSRSAARSRSWPPRGEAALAAPAACGANYRPGRPCRCAGGWCTAGSCGIAPRWHRGSRAAFRLPGQRRLCRGRTARGPSPARAAVPPGRATRQARLRGHNARAWCGRSDLALRSAYPRPALPGD